MANIPVNQLIDDLYRDPSCGPTSPRIASRMSIMLNTCGANDVAFVFCLNIGCPTRKKAWLVIIFPIRLEAQGGVNESSGSYEPGNMRRF